MSLTNSDLSSVRTMTREENSVLDGKVTAIQNDVKEIYYMLARMEKNQTPNKKFLKLTIEQKILSVYKELLLTAEEAHIVLPRS